MQTLVKTAKTIDKINEKTAKFAAVLCLLMVLVTAEQVIARYVFNRSSIALQELVWHLFGAVFLLGAAHTLKKDEHVRVDIFYARFSDKTKVWIELLGTTLFLAPMCVILVYTGIEFVIRA